MKSIKCLIKQAKHGLLIILLSHSLIYSQQMEIPRTSPKASISQTIGVCTVSLDYGRPSMRERKIFGGLVPYGKVWRAGANEATVISFDYPIQIDGKEITAGKYGLFMIPGEEKWTIILNREWNQWGAYNYNQQQDVLRIEVIPQQIAPTEMCTYLFAEVNKTSGVLNLDWEQTRISIPIETHTYEQTLSEIDKATRAATDSWYTFSAAAQYHFYECRTTYTCTNHMRQKVIQNRLLQILPK